ncbi:helix-turn-helix domain-containing protein, partial [Acinetobacter nosocomialis]
MIVCNLPVLLAERRMKVADVARATGMSKTTLHKLYNGQTTRIDFETL